MIKQIVILAGGLATRLYPTTKKIPKSMVLVNKKPFLEHQLMLCKKNKIKNVVLCVGHLWKQIRDYFDDGKDFGVNITYSIETERLDTGGALKNAFQYLNDVFFVMYGDSYLTINWQDIYKFYKKANKQGLMTVYENNWNFCPSQILLNNSKDEIIEFTKENFKPEMRHMEYGINILPKKIINKIKKKNFPIELYFHKLIKEKQLAAYISKEKFYEIGCHKGLREIGKIIN